MWQGGEGIREIFKKSMIYLRRYEDKDESGNWRPEIKRSVGS
jgi:hypothetical protein